MMIRHKIDVRHPMTMELERVLREAGCPMRQRDLALRVFPGSSNGAAMAATYMVPLIYGGRVRRVGRGLYEWVAPVPGVVRI